MVDLLSAREAAIDDKTREYRFNTALLTERLVTTTNQVIDFNPENFSLGYFGASTGATAAMAAAVAASSRQGRIKAIVSRGGRPDMAGRSTLNKDSALLFLFFIFITYIIAVLLLTYAITNSSTIPRTKKGDCLFIDCKYSSCATLPV